MVAALSDVQCVPSLPLLAKPNFCDTACVLPCCLRSARAFALRGPHPQGKDTEGWLRGSAEFQEAGGVTIAVALLASGPDCRIVRDALGVLVALLCGRGAAAAVPVTLDWLITCSWPSAPLQSSAFAGPLALLCERAVSMAAGRCHRGDWLPCQDLGC